MSNIQGDVICFYYNIQDLAEHVFKLTSYAGRMFSKEVGDYLLDKVKLTHDDRDIFDSFLQDALFRVADELSPFAKYLPEPIYTFRTYDNATLVYYEDGLEATVGLVIHNRIANKYYITIKETVLLSEEDLLDKEFFIETPHFELIELFIENLTWFNERAIHSADEAIKNALCYYVIYKWLVAPFPKEASYYLNEYDVNMVLINRRLNSQNEIINRRARYF